MAEKTLSERINKLVDQITECVKKNDLERIPRLAHELQKLKLQRQENLRRK